MSIIFYEMSGCHYCQMAKELLNDEIQKGIVLILPASSSPPGTRGFPFFVNKDNGLSYTGYPNDKQTLFEKLNYSFQENFTYDVQNIWIGIT